MVNKHKEQQMERALEPMGKRQRYEVMQTFNSYGSVVGCTFTTPYGIEVDMPLMLIGYIRTVANMREMIREFGNPKKLHDGYVSVIKTVRDMTYLGLFESKHWVDCLIERKSHTTENNSEFIYIETQELVLVSADDILANYAELTAQHTE
jgi:hypothetical protein